MLLPHLAKWILSLQSSPSCSEGLMVIKSRTLSLTNYETNCWHTGTVHSPSSPSTSVAELRRHHLVPVPCTLSPRALQTFFIYSVSLPAVLLLPTWDSSGSNHLRTRQASAVSPLCPLWAPVKQQTFLDSRLGPQTVTSIPHSRDSPAAILHFFPMQLWGSGPASAGIAYHLIKHIADTCISRELTFWS